MTEENALQVWTELVVGELHSLSHDPNLTFEQAKESLGQVYWQADARKDEATKQMALATLDKLEALANTSTAAISIAAAAKKVAQEMQAQRDTVIADRDEKVKELEKIDSEYTEIQSKIIERIRDDFQDGDDLIDNLVQSVEQSTHEWMVGMDADSMIYNLGLEVSSDSVENYNLLMNFASILTGDYEITPQAKSELEGFIGKFVTRVLSEQEDDDDEVFANVKVTNYPKPTPEMNARELAQWYENQATDVMDWNDDDTDAA